MSKSIQIETTMSIARITALALSLFFMSVDASAQVDGGGGMGGTGGRKESELLNPATAQGGDNTDCTKDRSIGAFDAKDKNSQRSLRQGYICRGYQIESGSNEILELYLRNGEKIILLEGSALVIE